MYFAQSVYELHPRGLAHPWGRNSNIIIQILYLHYFWLVLKHVNTISLSSLAYLQLT